MIDTLKRLEAAIGYAFNNRGFLDNALNHRSSTGPSNERLEFLGDSILNFVIAAQLFETRPKSREGELTRLRASLVNGESLAVLAAEMGLGDYLSLGAGELKSGGHHRSSILADSLEAVFGAVFLDSGFDACRQVILGIYRDRLANLPSMKELKDPKTQLQEWLQSRQQELPVYEIIETMGSSHEQRFNVQCQGGGVTTEASGTSRRRAEQEAARKALKALGA